MEKLREIRCFILDMDGTFYLGNRLLPGALAFMDYLQASGRDALFLTNNSSRSAGYYAEKLTRLGWPAKPEDILTSGEATALYLRNIRPQARIYLVGTPDLEQEFAASGFVITADRPDFVVVGFDTTLEYGKLATACSLIRADVPYIATHPDINCPTEDGYIPDCGAIMALIKASTGRSPKVIGKPNPEIIEAIFARKCYRPQQMAMVGDRLYTDIATAANAGIKGVLVLSGETRPEDLAAAKVRPDFVFDHLGGLRQALAEADALLKQ